MASAAAGPRLESAAEPFQKEVVNPDELPPDLYALAALIFGVIGLMMRHKLCAWLSLFAILGSIAGIKHAELDVRQMVTSVAFAGMGLMVTYFGKEKASG